MTGSWGVVVPVKRLRLAKSRLSSYGDRTRERFALAFAADVVESALQVAEVLVVTDDDLAASTLAALGARVTADDPDAGLNPALAHGADLLREGDRRRGVATLSADLPAVRPEELRSVLAQVGDGRGFVPDLDGTGTTALAAGPGQDLRPAFGKGSRDAHLSSGATQLVAGRGVRCDVDTPDDLLAALALGVGRHTAAVTTELGLAVTTATVKDWGVGGGSAYLHDGSTVPLPRECLEGSGFRFLRLGQRLRVATDPEGRTRVALP